MKYYIFTVLIFLFLLPACRVDAVTLYFDPAKIVSDVDKTVEAQLMIDTNGEVINTVEGELIVSEGLKIDGVYFGNSILTFWIQPPIVSGNKINFSGIIPGGFRGVLGTESSQPFGPGNILTILFKAIEPGSQSINIKDTKVLLNDGQGTEISTDEFAMEFRSKKGEGTDFIIKDEISPNIISAEIITDPNFDNQKVLIFLARDYESGIDYYEIKEGNENWLKITSPYILKNQYKEENIKLKAVDYFGNIAVVDVFTVDKKDKSKTLWILISVFAILFIVVIFKKRINKNAF